LLVTFTAIRQLFERAQTCFCESAKSAAARRGRSIFYHRDPSSANRPIVLTAKMLGTSTEQVPTHFSAGCKVQKYCLTDQAIPVH